jgi:hypothetical protein
VFLLLLLPAACCLLRMQRAGARLTAQVTMSCEGKATGGNVWAQLRHVQSQVKLKGSPWASWLQWLLHNAHQSQ